VIRLPALLLLSLTAAGQSISSSDPASLFDSPPTGPAFRCEIRAVQPALNYGLRFQAGYVITFALKQFTGSGHGVRVLTRITPDGRPPVFVTQSVDLPEVPPTRLIGALSGSILIGEGGYRVETRVEDDQHRVCRADWRMRAHRDGAEQKFTPAMAPGAVATLSSTTPSARAPDASTDAGRLTVLLHAAALRGRSSILQESDIQRLTGTLAALLERVKARKVRLIVFNLDQQKELLRREDFTTADIDRVTRALDDLQVATVDYKVLRDPKGGVNMLAGMLDAELRGTSAGDAVVVLGPEARTRARLAPPPDRPEDAAARVFYLQFLSRPGAPPPGSSVEDLGGRGGRGGSGRGAGGGGGAVAGGGGGSAGRGGGGRGGPGGGPGRGLGPPVPPDTIQRIVKQFKGTVIAVRSPQDFARAVARMNRPQ
jgi:hypothetical protein